MLKLFYCILYVFLHCLHLCLPEILKESVDIYKKDFVPRIYNGWPAKYGDVPYQIALKALKSRAENMYQTFCGGSIITTTKLVSAAHCFEEEYEFSCGKIFGDFGNKASRNFLSKVFAVAGNLQNVAEHDSSDSLELGQWRRISEAIYHEEYEFPDHDIAIVVTKDPFIFNINVGPIPYASKYINYEGYCLTSGFGDVMQDVKAKKLYLVHLFLMEASMCDLTQEKDMHNFLCTMSSSYDVGKGDSGGPLVCKNTTDPNEKDRGVLVGITCGTTRGVSSFFTRVSAYNSFIQNHGVSLNADHAYLIFIRLFLIHLM